MERSEREEAVARPEHQWVGADLHELLASPHQFYYSQVHNNYSSSPNVSLGHLGSLCSLQIFMSFGGDEGP